MILRLDSMNYIQRARFARKILGRISLKKNAATRLFLERIIKTSRG